MNREQIRKKVQVHIGDTEADRLEPEEVNVLIEGAYNRAAALFLSINESLFVEDGTFPLQPTVELYDLPVDFLRIKEITDPNKNPLHRLYKLGERSAYLGHGSVTHYYFQKKQIGFLDIPPTSIIIPYKYIYSPAALVNDESIPDVPEFLGHDLIVIESALDARDVDEEASAHLIYRAKQLYSQIGEVYYRRNTDELPEVPSDPLLDELDF